MNIKSLKCKIVLSSLELMTRGEANYMHHDDRTPHTEREVLVIMMRRKGETEEEEKEKRSK